MSVRLEILWRSCCVCGYDIFDATSAYSRASVGTACKMASAALKSESTIFRPLLAKRAVQVHSPTRLKRPVLQAQEPRLPQAPLHREHATCERLGVARVMLRVYRLLVPIDGRAVLPQAAVDGQYCVAHLVQQGTYGFMDDRRLFDVGSDRDADGHAVGVVAVDVRDADGGETRVEYPLEIDIMLQTAAEEDQVAVDEDLEEEVDVPTGLASEVLQSLECFFLEWGESSAWVVVPLHVAYHC